jgi:hypothetical protein
MKKIRLILSAFAFSLAVVAAFAFKPLDGIQPSFVNAQGQCEETATPCPGTGTDCILNIPEDGSVGARQLYEYRSGTTCGVALKMSN